MLSDEMMLSIETLSIVFTGLSISLAAFYYINTLRNSQRAQQLSLETRQAQLFMQIYDRWSSREITKMEWEFRNWEWDDFDDYLRKYNSDVESISVRAVIGKYYEGIGVLIKRGLIDPTLVDDLMSSAILGYWEKWGPIVEEWRVRMGMPQASEYQEYLYNTIKAIAEEQHPELRD
jgi:hypothetical protein